MRRFVWDNATIKVDWNLDRPIPWTAEAARRAGTLHLAEGVNALTESSAALAQGLLPATPFLVMGQQSMTDPTRMPAGKETVWAYSHIPREVHGDAAGEIVGPLDRQRARPLRRPHAERDREARPRLRRQRARRGT